MTDINPACLSEAQLNALLAQSNCGSEQTELQSHLEGCSTCQQRLESLVAGSESWHAAVALLQASSEIEAEPELSDAVRRIKADDSARASANVEEHGQPVELLEPSDQPGSLGRLGSYEVSEVVGQGGMGVVFKAFDPTLHRVVAVKVLAPYLAHNPRARQRFVREAQAIAAVSHDHVITVHAIDESAEQPKIIMQFVAGRSLQEKLDAEGSLPVKEILRIGMQTAAGLAAAHAQGLVHRDVKPSNILLENGIQRVKLTDFGLARAADDASLTQSGVIAGTPQYMAPEQANGDAVDYRADLFSLGSVMYAMCVGHSPFRASTTMGVLKRVCHDSPRPIQELNPDIPEWLCQIIMKLLAKSPGARFDSAKQVSMLLEQWLAHLQQPAAVPKPGRIDGADRMGFKPFDHSAVARQLADKIFERTIFFQPISGRMFLFLFLTGMAGAMAFASFQSLGVLELLLVSLMGGMFIAFWGLLLIALVQFLMANGLATVRWFQGKDEDTGESQGEENSSRRFRLAPESIAALAAIGTMILGAHFLIAAIVAIIVWRMAIARGY